MIIFDIDDTLTDTSGSLTPIQLTLALKAMQQEGLSISSFDRSLQNLFKINEQSLNAKEALKKFLEGKDPDSKFYKTGILKVYHEFPVNFQINPLPNAKKVLKILSKKHDLAIVSSGERQTQILKLKKAGIEPSFFCRIDITNTDNKKPFYENIFIESKLQSKKILMCGDKVNVDLIPAKELGFTTVHILWGRGKNQVSDKKWVDYTIGQLPELLKIVEEL